MIEPTTIVRWAHELAEFLNGYEGPHPLYTAEDAEDDAAFQLPTSPRMPKQSVDLRKRMGRALARLAKAKRSKTVNPDLARIAAALLDHPLVRATNDNFNFTPMDGVLALNAGGRLQLAHARFRSIDAQYAATFAELIQPTAPGMIKRCITCEDFFIQLPLRQRPWAHCPRHREEIRRTKKKPSGEAR
jgi:hypothetical protein